MGTAIYRQTGLRLSYSGLDQRCGRGKVECQQGDRTLIEDIIQGNMVNSPRHCSLSIEVNIILGIYHRGYLFDDEQHCALK